MIANEYRNNGHHRILVLKRLSEKHQDPSQLDIHRQAEAEVLRDSNYDSSRKLQAMRHNAVGFSQHRKKKLSTVQKGFPQLFVTIFARHGWGGAQESDWPFAVKTTQAHAMQLPCVIVMKENSFQLCTRTTSVPMSFFFFFGMSEGNSESSREGRDE